MLTAFLNVLVPGSFVTVEVVDHDHTCCLVISRIRCLHVLQFQPDGGHHLFIEASRNHGD